MPPLEQELQAVESLVDAGNLGSPVSALTHGAISAA